LKGTEKFSKREIVYREKGSYRISRELRRSKAQRGIKQLCLGEKRTGKGLTTGKDNKKKVADSGVGVLPKNIWEASDKSGVGVLTQGGEGLTTKLTAAWGQTEKKKRGKLFLSQRMGTWGKCRVPKNEEGNRKTGHSGLLGWGKYTVADIRQNSLKSNPHIVERTKDR